jgi:HK97 family phage portal protein
MFKTRVRLRLTRGRGHHATKQRALAWPSDMPSVFGGRAGDVTPSTALAIGDAYACVRALADAAASLPLIAYRRRQDGSRERYQGRIAELLERPAPAVTQANLIGQVVAHLNTWGNAYVGKFRDGDRITQLALLAPDRVQVELVAGEPRYVYVDPRGRRSTLTTRDVLHVRALSADGIVGLSPIRQARETVGDRDLRRPTARRAVRSPVGGRGPGGRRDPRKPRMGHG